MTMNVNPLIVVSPSSPINTDQTSIVARNLRGEASKENAESSVAPVEETLEVQKQRSIDGRNPDDILNAKSEEQQIQFLNERKEREAVDVQIDQAKIFEESQAFKERLAEQKLQAERHAEQVVQLQEVQDKNVLTLNSLLSLGAVGTGIHKVSDVDEIV